MWDLTSLVLTAPLVTFLMRDSSARDLSDVLMWDLASLVTFLMWDSPRDRYPRDLSDVLTRDTRHSLQPATA